MGDCRIVPANSGDAREAAPGSPAPLAVPVTILVADARVMAAEAMAQAVMGADGLAVTARCSDRAGVALACAEVEPDVAVLDVSLYGGDPDLAVRSLREVALSAKVLLSLARLDVDGLARALLAGAENCISGQVDRLQFIDAVRATAAGESIVPRQLSNGLSQALVQVHESRLSHRELEVLQLAAIGLSVLQIAAELCVSPNTAQTHLRRSYRKLGVHNRSGAIAEAQRLGVLRIGPHPSRVTDLGDK
jgi:DNA-binding NarL/FixJ family response regulator